MRSLHIDFQARRRPSASGWLLLAAGLAAAAVAGHQEYGLAQQRATQAQRLARVQVAGANLASSEPDDPRVIAARQLLDRSRLPWQTLFSALEAADSADVALLAVAPDVTRRQVKLQAEARDLAAMLAFQRQLQQNPALAQVVLANHTVMKDVPDTPVRFQIQAQWGGSRVNP
jgi:hypothetical protein